MCNTTRDGAKPQGSNIRSLSVCECVCQGFEHWTTCITARVRVTGTDCPRAFVTYSPPRAAIGGQEIICHPVRQGEHSKNNKSG